MEVSITNQAYVFLCSVVGGIIVGFVFDIFRIFRRFVKTSNIVIYLQDILFWILVTLIIFALVFVTNNGELRWYEFLGVILGVIFYSLAFSPFVIRVSVTVINFFKKIILLIIKILLFPFAVVYKIFRKPCKALVDFLKRSYRKMYRLARNTCERGVRSVKHLRRIAGKV
ncbi:MAG: spore cortex biosynthesis protein YabQ [Clostridiaceae bacterium]|nr:spore cortex biosynthesis protein YabQ [Clostridiaceae bacterium]